MADIKELERFLNHQAYPATAAQLTQTAKTAKLPSLQLKLLASLDPNLRFKTANDAITRVEEIAILRKQHRDPDEAPPEATVIDEY